MTGKRFRQQDVTRAVVGLLKAGLSVDRTEIDPTGRIIIVTREAKALEASPDETPEALRKLL
ncbi:hypothetical protein [Bradyrhizobium vignae]|uniref:Uncharacterized protein n=1 Tax=Bradyrhizobium vignae TaxID=1549949 RepID=A0ABS3ZSB6_9BRAD|nr:hypothetical protein [Bradyrhizobium vignae]MBP0111057.1 hypothetical protein [Bradyrhizobium vignae]